MKGATTYLKLFSLFGDIYIIFNLDVPDDIKPDISHTKNQHILYVFSFKFSMHETFMFDKLLHDMFTLFIANVLFSKL
jgi:hypothetical protein